MSRVASFFTQLGYRSFMLTGQMYLATASLIGFETLAVIVGYGTVWPVGVPLVIACIAIYAVVKRRVVRRREASPEVD